MNKRDIGKLAKQFASRLQDAEVALMDEKDLKRCVEDLLLDHPDLDLDESQIEHLKTRVRSRVREWGPEPELIL